MADFSATAAINIVLDNSVTGSPVMKLIDTTPYSSPDALTVKGYAVVTQPDGVVETHGSFSSPAVSWVSGALTQPTWFLRLANNNAFQNGTYKIVYNIRVTGYTDTVLTKTFTVNFTAPIPVITQGFNNFTPSLRVTDATSYGIAGLTYIGITQTWAGIINSVSGTPQNITGAGATFDLAYLGSYYDSLYNVTLTSVVTWQIPAASPFVTLLDQFILSETFQAEIPPTLAQLLDSLTAMKLDLDANINNSSVYVTKQSDYTYAESIYQHLIKRGQTGSLSGLSDYVWQLQKIFNHNVTPAYVNTNGVIPAYDWGTGGGGSVAWNSITGKPATVIMTWTVGDGGFPGNGATTVTNAGFAGFNITCFRNNQFEPMTKTLGSTTATFSSGALSTGEKLYVQSIPL